MSFDLKICQGSDNGELIFGQADVYFFDAVTACTGDMMVVVVSADTIVMGSIGKLDATQQAHRDELLYRAVDRCSPHSWFLRAHRVPEIINRKIGAALRQRDQPFRDQPPGTCVALAHFVKRCVNLIC